MLQTTDGYVFYHTGFAPDAVYTAGTYPVLAGMDTDAEAPLQDLLLAGEIMGEVSYTRPMGSYKGKPAIWANTSQLFPASPITTNDAVLLGDSSSRVLVSLGYASSLVLEFMLENSTAGSKTVRADFRLRKLLESPLPATAWFEWVAFATLTVPESEESTVVIPYEVPGPGLYEIGFRVQKSAGGNIGTDELRLRAWLEAHS